MCLSKAWSLSTGPIASPQGIELLHRAKSLSMAQISLPAIEERSGRVKKAKIGPNMFFSDLTNDQRGLLIRVR